MKKGQISVELIIIVSVLLILFIFFFGTINIRNKFSKSFAEKLAAEEVGLLISTGINDVYLGGESTNKSIEILDELRTGTDFNITINSTLRIINVNYLDDYVSFPILTSDLKGSFVTGTNYLINSKGGIEIVN